MNTYDYDVGGVEIYRGDQLGGEVYNLIVPLPRLGVVKVLVEWYRGDVDVRAVTGRTLKRYKYQNKNLDRYQLATLIYQIYDDLKSGAIKF